jgi:ribosomal protein bL25 (Ctc-form)
MATNKFAVSATPREGKFNKNHARRVRVAGLIPAVVYGAGQPAVAVTVDPKVVTKILHSESGHNTIFDLEVVGSGALKAMIVDWQHEPIKGKLLHIDFKRIAMDKPMRVSVPIQLTGVPAGVKTSGAFRPRFPITSMSTSPASSCTARSTSPTCRTPARSSSSPMSMRSSPTSPSSRKRPLRMCSRPPLPNPKWPRRARAMPPLPLLPPTRKRSNELVSKAG